MVSVERVQEYSHLKPEAELEMSDRKSSNTWPEHGEIVAENLFFCYHPSLLPVLKNVTFHIKAKEKVETACTSISQHQQKHALKRNTGY